MFKKNKQESVTPSAELSDEELGAISGGDAQKFWASANGGADTYRLYVANMPVPKFCPWCGGSGFKTGQQYIKHLEDKGCATFADVHMGRNKKFCEDCGAGPMDKLQAAWHCKKKSEFSIF